MTGRQINDLNPVENIWSIINERYKDPAPKAMANWEGAYALPRKRWLLKRVISMPSHLEFVLKKFKLKGAILVTNI